jgi:prepilin-type N-terminal cleavage/methylation domain-containing protein
VKGFTLFELLIVMTVSGIVLAIAVPRARAGLDRAVVRSAATDVRATLGLARTLALAGHAVIVVDVDSAGGMLRIRRGSAVLQSRGLQHAHGVELRATRDSVTYDPYGMGRGASNLSVVIRKGVAAETVFVSRLGRIR